MTRAPDQGTRDRILTAAIDEIAAVGWGGCRTRSIAKRAGVNSGVIHYHFSSIEDLLVEAVATAYASFADVAAQSIGAETVAGGLEGMLDFVSHVDPADPTWQVLMEALMQARRVPRLAELTIGLLDEYHGAVSARLAVAVEQGELPEGTDTEALGLGILALLDGLGLYAYVNPDYDVAGAGMAIVSMLTKGGTRDE